MAYTHLKVGLDLSLNECSLYDCLSGFEIAELAFAFRKVVQTGYSCIGFTTSTKFVVECSSNGMPEMGSLTKLRL